MSGDAGADAQPAPDSAVGRDLAFTGPDAAKPAPDLALPDLLSRDSGSSDAAGGPDLLGRDATRADARVADASGRDARADAIEVVVRDATIAEVLSDARDLAGSDAISFADTREVAGDPLAGRSFRIDDMNPAPTPDSTCTQSGPASAVQLTFSADMATLTAVASSGSAAFRFTATLGPEASRLTYHVEELAGGFVFVERDQGVYVAQVILTGSGVPVLWCLRGALTPQP